MPIVTTTYETALAASEVLGRLRRFDARLVGTLPLDLAVPGSDIDIVCHAPDALAFSAALWSGFRAGRDFSLHQWRGGMRAVVARFRLLGWPFEIFGAPVPVEAQAGWRHFEVERRLLALGGAPFRAEVRAARRLGLKTEPAFAAVLGLCGDPYAALLDLFAADDGILAGLLAGRGCEGRRRCPET